jgi:hypothetical protein
MLVDTPDQHDQQDVRVHDIEYARRLFHFSMAELRAF